MAGSWLRSVLPDPRTWSPSPYSILPPDNSIIQLSHHGTTLTLTVWVAKILCGFSLPNVTGEMARYYWFGVKLVKSENQNILEHGWLPDYPWKGTGNKYSNYCFSGWEHLRGHPGQLLPVCRRFLDPGKRLPGFSTCTTFVKGTSPPTKATSPYWLSQVV